MTFATMPTSNPGQTTPAVNIQPVAGCDSEVTVWSGRTHWKILVGPALLQLALIAAHVALARWWPQNSGVSWIDNWGQLTVHGVILAVEVWYVFAPILRWMNSTFTVTSRRVIRRWGILYKHSREVPLERIVSVAVERGIIDRVFGCGTLAFHDAAAAMQPQTHGAWNSGVINDQGAGVRFHDVPHVHKVHQIVDQARYGNAAH